MKNEFLMNLPIKDKTYWWAYWYIDNSFKSLNNSVDLARKQKRFGDAESLCEVIALKHSYDKRDTTCPECSGSGNMDELYKSKINSQTISPPYHSVECNACEGSGRIK